MKNLLLLNFVVENIFENKVTDHTYCDIDRSLTISLRNGLTEEIKQTVRQIEENTTITINIEGSQKTLKFNDYDVVSDDNLIRYYFI